MNTVEPYLTFDGNCEEAVELYKKVLNAEVLFSMRFKDSPDEHPEGMLPPGFENKIMHLHMKIFENSVMATDGGGCSGGSKGFHGFALTIALDSVDEAQRIFKELSAGGQVMMPPMETFFAKTFSSFSDKFGVPWMVIVQKPMQH
ncbi:MAG TPA: VOC family protein [Rhodocyclaceae bacterium]|nr:VOC family protein [Rhodocyclaceae bacterium]